MDSNMNTLSEEISGKLYEVTSVFTHPLYQAINTPPMMGMGMGMGMGMHPGMGMGMGMHPGLSMGSIGSQIYSPMYNHNSVYH